MKSAILWLLGAIGLIMGEQPRAATYAKLPPKLEAQLQRWECKVEVAPGSSTHNNVLNGSFGGSKGKDWALICDEPRRTTLLIFLGGEDVKTDELLYTYKGDGVHLKVRQIEKVDATFIQQHCILKPFSPAIDHDGILDSLLKVVRYHAKDHWYEFKLKP